MVEEKYFVTYMPYSDYISSVCVLVGETAKYYRVKSVSSKAELFYLLNKKTLVLRGSDIRYYELPVEEIKRKIARQKAIRLCENTKWKELTDSQLERIKKILEEK